MPVNVKRPAPLADGGGAGNDRLGEPIAPDDSPDCRAGQGGLVDRFGNVHSEAILRNWSPATIRAMGIRRADGGAA